MRYMYVALVSATVVLPAGAAARPVQASRASNSAAEGHTGDAASHRVHVRARPAMPSPHSTPTAPALRAASTRALKSPR